MGSSNTEHPLKQPKPRKRVGLRAMRTVGAVAVALFAAALPVASSDRANAHGDAVEIFRGREGRYELVVGVQPARPAVGTVHFSLTPLDGATSQLVTDAEIVIVASSQGEDSYQVRAVNTPASPRYYDANITFEAPGIWTLDVRVDSPELGGATFTLRLNVENQSIGPGVGGSVIFLIVFLVLVGGGVYVWYSGRRQRQASQGQT